MIFFSEHKFASYHSSFWRTIMPMAEPFVRALNANLTQFAPPRTLGGILTRHAVVSELSFRLFSESITAGLSLQSESDINPARREKLESEVRLYISALDRSTSSRTVSQNEYSEALILAQRLANYISTEAGGRPIVARPRFIGCGSLQDCEGDILVGTTLYELKNVDRDFRITDVRQLLSYCALNFLSKEHVIENVALVNARNGSSYSIGVNALCLAVSGTTASEMLSDVVEYLSRDRQSR